MDTSRYPSGISPFGSILSSEELSVHSTASFLNDAEAAGGGICSLTISSSPTNVISVAEFLATSTGSFFCFWTPLNFGIFLRQLLFRMDCFCPIFPPFGMALLLLWARFTRSQHEQRNDPVFSIQAFFKLWKYTQISLGRDYRNKRIIGLKKDSQETLKVHLFETVAMETDQQTCTRHKDWTFLPFSG